MSNVCPIYAARCVWKSIGSVGMSDQDDWDFAGATDAKAEIRAAAAGGTRGDIVREIIEIVHEVANGLPPEQPNPLDDGLPGG